MEALDLKFGIPDIELGSVSGPRINPSSFAGHELIVLFCPLTTQAARSEIGSYRSHSAQFVEHDAWLLAIADEPGVVEIDGGGRVLTIPDPRRRAWNVFCDLIARPGPMDRQPGATFLFTRGGNLHRYWIGAGHVDDVLEELRSPSSEHPHQA